MATGDLLETPTFLIAMHQVLDPFFHRSLVLLVHHDEDGSFGFIVNRTTGIKVSEILAGMKIEWQGPSDTFAHFGGPVQPQLGSVLFDNVEPLTLEAASPVFGEVEMTQHVGDLERIAAGPGGEVRLFLGYAGWGAGQLMEEIERDDWLLAPVDRDLLFTSDPDSCWERALERVGIDPASLPSWHLGGGESEGTN